MSVLALATHSLAAPSTRPQAQTAKSAEDQTARDTLLELAAALMTGGAIATAAGGRKKEVHYHNDDQSHKPQHHHAISTLIHLLLTIGSAFAPLVGAIVGPLLTNVANGITWAISHTIASGKFKNISKFISIEPIVNLIDRGIIDNLPNLQHSIVIFFFK